jgi:hypothetical protein
VSEKADVDPPWAWTADHQASVESMLRENADKVGSFLVRMGARVIDANVARVFVEANQRGACPPAGTTQSAWLAAIALEGVEVEAKVSLAPPDSIRHFLLMLEPTTRAVFILFEIDGETSRAIAVALGLSVEAVHEQIAEGQRCFRRAFDDVRAQPAGPRSLLASPTAG